MPNHHCKTCDFWARRGKTAFGDCACEELRMKSTLSYIPQAHHKASLIAEIWDDRAEDLYTGEDFGCIHWMHEELECDKD